MPPEPLFRHCTPLLHFTADFWHEEKASSLIQLLVLWLEIRTAMFSLWDSWIQLVTWEVCNLKQCLRGFGSKAYLRLIAMQQWVSV